MEFSFLKRNWKGRRGKGLHLHSWIARAFLFLPASYFSLVITSFLSDVRYWDLPWRLNLFLVLQSRGTSATYFTTQWNKPQTQRWSYNKYIIETWEHQTFLRRIILHTSHSNFYSFRDKFKNSRIIINGLDDKFSLTNLHHVLSLSVYAESFQNLISPSINFNHYPITRTCSRTNFLSKRELRLHSVYKATPVTPIRSKGWKASQFSHPINSRKILYLDTRLGRTARDFSSRFIKSSLTTLVCSSIHSLVSFPKGIVDPDTHIFSIYTRMTNPSLRSSQT